VEAVLIGSLEPPPTRRSFPPDRAMRAVLDEVVVPLRVPVLQDLPVGHLPGKWTVPLGGCVDLDASRGRLVFDPRPPR
jgi:muramoyltetrapeptide carboxypeptidase LdcA involved in peptidoglycan recycling